jgi:hypothetical protein
LFSNTYARILVYLEISKLFVVEITLNVDGLLLRYIPSYGRVRVRV